MQADPPPSPAQPGPINVHIDFSGLANLIGQWFIDHLPDFGGAIWSGIKANLPDIGTSIWTPLAYTLLGALQGAVQAVWSATFGALANIRACLLEARQAGRPARALEVLQRHAHRRWWHPPGGGPFGSVLACCQARERL